MRGDSNQRGFTLIEVLVALLVFSIGLLGLAALQTTSLKFNQTAYFRSQATILAHSIMDQLRADRESALNENYDIGLNEAAGSTSESAVKIWRKQVAADLPQRGSSQTASGRIDVAPSSGVATIEIAWGERDDSSNSVTQQSFTFESRL